MARDLLFPDAVEYPAAEPFRLIEPDGSRTGADALELDDESLRGWYRDMVVVRRLDAEATALQRQGQLGLWPPSLGQEAAQIGSARQLRAEDFVFPSYREHGVAHCRGASPADLIRVWRGSAFSGWDPRSIGMASAQVVIGAHALHAVGYAMGIAWDGAAEVAMVYLGEGAMSEGDTSEAMVFAASFNAPVVFFVQNNQWAISEPASVQSRVPLAARGPGFGIPSLRVDGNDVLAVAVATAEALDRARRGEGPSLIEAVTYRMGPHTTADDPTRYRAEDELELWRERDPISRLEKMLSSSGTLSDADRAQTTARADEAAAELRAACQAMPDPDPLSVFDHVYAGAHHEVDQQRASYADYLDSFEEAP